MSRPTPKQWKIILEFFENNPEMVSGRASAPNAKQVIKEKWETLAAQLNSLGYTNKSVEKWQKVDCFNRYSSKLSLANSI